MNTRASLVSNACLFCNTWGRTLLFVGQEGNFARIVPHSELQRKMIVAWDEICKIPTIAKYVSGVRGVFMGFLSC